MMGHLRSLLLYLAGLFTHRLLSGASYHFSPTWQWGSVVDKRAYPFRLGGSSFNLSTVKYSDSSFAHIQPVPSDIFLFRAPTSNASFLDTIGTAQVLKSGRNFLASTDSTSIGSFYLLLICLAITFTALRVVRFVKSSLDFEAFSSQNACQPMGVAPNPFPWKLRRYFELSKIDANLLDDYLLKKFQNNGLTHGFATVFSKKIKAVATIEPANFQAVLATRFDDWERPKFRAGAAKPFLKVGILTLVRYPPCLGLKQH
jgi:hypothetical protein